MVRTIAGALNQVTRETSEPRWSRGAARDVLLEELEVLRMQAVDLQVRK